jgi:hypothetical protein
MNSSRAFFTGLVIGLFLFLVANLLAAHLHSDCGLPAILGTSHCADDIIRAGFPVTFIEKGGFVFRLNFSSLSLLVDIYIGLGFAVFSGILTQRYFHKPAESTASE